MAQSKYVSTRETTNLARLARVILGPCTDVLRAVLANHFTPQALSHNVKTFLANYQRGKKPPITKNQQTLVNSGTFSNFDITLLYSLLRNICPITPHGNQWGNDPSPNDRSLSANIERIRLKRNEYGHISIHSIKNTDFKKTWQEISQVIQELDTYLGTTSTKYQDAVHEIETCSMDPEQTEKYIEQLLEMNKKLQNISAEVENIKTSVVPWNVKAMHNEDISKWKEDDNFFLETHNFPTMLEKVRNQSFVTFVGAPGAGKSATAHHIALKLQDEEGYDILPIRDIKEIETYCDPCNPQVFVIDDVLGVFGLDMVKLICYVRMKIE